MGSSLHRGPVGEPRGGLFTGTFERKRKCTFGFHYLNPEDTKFTSRGHQELWQGKELP